MKSLEQFILRGLLVLCAGTIFGNILIGCAAQRSDVRAVFVTRQPAPGVELFVCGYADGYSPGADVQCIDWQTFMAPPKAHPPEDSHAL